MVDSCAFAERVELAQGEIVKNERLSFEDALQRQIAHAYEFRYASLVERLVSYDLLIDEKLTDASASSRWSMTASAFAVSKTIQAARYLAGQRRRIARVFGHPVSLVFTCQGSNVEQYAYCAEQIVQVMQPGDVFGLGGWAVSGLIRQAMLPAAASILPVVFEVLGRAGIRQVHIFGVILPALLGFLLWLCDQHGIALSTDSAGPAIEPGRNSRWGYGCWADHQYRAAPILDSCKALDTRGRKVPVCTPDARCRGLERARHVALTRDYLSHFRTREPGLVGPDIMANRLQSLHTSSQTLARVIANGLR